MSKQSIEALKQQVESGKYLSDQARVFASVTEARASLKELVTKMGMKVQTVSARLSELQDQGVIAQDNDGRFYATLPEYHDYHATQRRKKRFTNWVRKGEDEGFFAMMQYGQ